MSSYTISEIDSNVIAGTITIAGSAMTFSVTTAVLSQYMTEIQDAGAIVRTMHSDASTKSDMVDNAKVTAISNSDEFINALLALLFEHGYELNKGSL